MLKTPVQNTAYEDVQRAIMCLRLEVDETIANDITRKVNNAIASAIAAAKRDMVAKVMEAFPTNWTDGLLTGPNAVIGNPPFGCPDIEALLHAIKERIRSQVETKQEEE